MEEGESSDAHFIVESWEQSFSKSSVSPHKSPDPPPSVETIDLTDSDVEELDIYQNHDSAKNDKETIAGNISKRFRDRIQVAPLNEEPGVNFTTLNSAHYPQEQKSFYLAQLEKMMQPKRKRQTKPKDEAAIETKKPAKRYRGRFARKKK